MDKSSIVWSLRVMVIFSLFYGTHAVICPHCNLDFVSLGRHIWRCRARITGGGLTTPPLAPTPMPSSPPSLNTMSMIGGTDPSPGEWKCVCGRVCKGRRGLRSHQRACRTFATLSSGLADVNIQPDPPTVNNPPLASNSPPPMTGSIITGAGSIGSTTRTGIKLPTKPCEWAEANAYFASINELYDQPTDVNSYTDSLQSTIYNYFASNFGLNTSSKLFDAEWSKCSMKTLKAELKQLKLSSPRDVDRIKLLSKFIRNKLKSGINNNDANNIKGNFTKSFWKTCKSVFETCNNICPSFSIQVAYDYFKSILTDKSNGVFNIPSWFPELPDPTHLFNTSPPSYQEVTRAINKVKNKSSPCPFDQIPILAFKKCPILRTFLHKLLVCCWERSDIPTIWGRGLTVLLYKKGPVDQPENFRPITLQPVGYKILSSVIRSRITQFLMENDFVNKSIQKGFWPRSNGVTEHTSVLTHMLEDAKRHQRSIVVTLLDLRNAFGEVSHSLIYKALTLHKIPPNVINLISNIYNCATVSVSVNDKITDQIKVKRGVLQGDPCSPLLFNICFNMLIRTIAQDKFKSLGFAWGPSTISCATSWLQFADDSALVSHDCKSAQSLIDIASAWCKWSNMFLRPDKCITFGMAKINGVFSQFEPKLFIDGTMIPAVKSGGSFKYLGKIFSFQMDNSEIKVQLLSKLKALLEKISLLKISAQSKLKIVRLYLPTQFTFQLRLYCLPQTWISNYLDSIIVNQIRTWLQYPINTCVAEIMHLPLSKGGLGIPSFKSIAQKQCLSVRAGLRDNSDESIRLVWAETAIKNIPTDSLLKNSNFSKANQTLDNVLKASALDHVKSLVVQGSLVNAINEEIDNREVKRWSTCTLALSESCFKFARKALQQQLATAANMVRWGRSNSNLCSLCRLIQTNKHVLANCPAPGPLSRYTNRHNSILAIIVDYLTSVLPPSSTLYADLPNKNPINLLFNSLRPDLVVCANRKLTVIELTVCHETNFAAAKLRKNSKYSNIKDYLNSGFLEYEVKVATLEISVLGFISDINALCNLLKIAKFPVSILNKITATAIDHSRKLYINRNVPDEDIIV